MAETGSLVLAVHGDGRAPEPGVRVHLPFLEREQVSDANGRVRFDDLPVGRVHFELLKLGWDYDRTTTDVAMGRVDIAAGVTTFLHVTGYRVSPVEVRVWHVSDAALAHRPFVTLHHADGHRRISTPVDADGIARFDAVPSGDYTLAIQGYDLAPRVAVPTRAPVVATVATEPFREATFSGRIVTEAGEPIAWAELELRDLRGRVLSPHPSARADASGQYRFVCRAERLTAMLDWDGWVAGATELRANVPSTLVARKR